MGQIVIEPLFLFGVSKWHKVSVMAKQKKERECFYHHIISKKWALEQVFLEFSVRASSNSEKAIKGEFALANFKKT